MARTMGFGGRSGEICQMAYVVKDIDEAIAWWIEKMGVGPWFVLDSFGGEGHVYAFAVGLAEGGAISGWVPESAVYRKNTLAKMPTVSPDKPGQGFYETDWVVIQLPGGILEWTAPTGRTHHTRPPGTVRFEPIAAHALARDPAPF